MVAAREWDYRKRASPLLCTPFSETAVPSKRDKLAAQGAKAIAESYPMVPVPERTTRPNAHGVGRPTKLTHALLEDAVQLVEAGNYLNTAAGALGISYDTWRNWMERGEKEAKLWNEIVEAGGDPTEVIWDTLYIQFFVAISRAEHMAIASVVTLLKRHALTDARAAVEFLQRRDRANWSKETRITGDENAPLVVKVAAPLYEPDTTSDPAEDDDA